MDANGEWLLPLLRLVVTTGFQAATSTSRAVYHDDAVASVARAIVGLVYHAGRSSLGEARNFVHAHFLSRSALRHTNMLSLFL
jgi:hypothetical protein